jgi:hypothetical protein
VYFALRRALVLCSVFVALYVIVGSYIFADWWYGFFGMIVMVASRTR